MGRSGIRQGQAPYGGGTTPSDFGAVIFQEEWESGRGNHPVLGAGSQLPPARWRDWLPNGSGGPPGSMINWIEVLQQRLMVLGPLPNGGPNQWCGVLTPFPQDAVEFQGNLLDGQIAIVSFFHRCGLGTGGQLYLQNTVANAHGLIVSETDLLADPAGLSDGPFHTLGMRFERQGSGDGEIVTFAQLVSHPNASGIPLASVEQAAGPATGLLFRLDMVIERIQPPELPVETETELIAYYSTDNGENWAGIGQSEMKGMPRVIGFGVSGYELIGSFDAFSGQGASSFIRGYQLPVAETTFYKNPDGGRNW